MSGDLTHPLRCLRCGYEFEAYDYPFRPEAKPKAGDLSACLNCGNVAVFTEAMELRALTPEEAMRLPPETREEMTRLEAVRLRTVDRDLRKAA